MIVGPAIAPSSERSSTAQAARTSRAADHVIVEPADRRTHRRQAAATVGDYPMTGATAMQPTQWTTPPAPAKPAAARRPRQWPWLALIGLLGMAVGIVGTLAVQKFTSGGKPAKPAAAQAFNVHGNLTLKDYSTILNQCRGAGGYSDISGGTQVVIYDATGRSLAVGSLLSGAAGDAGCVYTFDIIGVPVGGGGPYAVEVSHRGKITFTRAQASDVEMSLG